MPQRKYKLMRISTVALSIKLFCGRLIKEISADYEVVVVASPGSDLEEIAGGGIRVCPVSMNRRISPIADIISLIKLFFLFRRERPDIVHSMTPKAGLLSMVAAMLAGVPIRLHTFTGLLFPTAKGVKKVILKITDFITCECATHVQAEGHGVRRDLRENGVCRKQIDVLGHGNLRGIDLRYYNTTQELKKIGQDECNHLGIPHDTKIILFVGRIVRDKGIRELVMAFQHFGERHPDWALLMVGKEEAEDPLPSALKSKMYSCPKIFRTSGWVEDVRPYYSVAHILLLPSYREGFPNVVLEAGAMCLPSIVTDVNGSREIISNGYNGLVVAPHDAEALNDAMCVLASSATGRRIMGERARQHVAERYEIESVTKYNVDYYERLTALIEKN